MVSRERTPAQQAMFDRDTVTYLRDELRYLEGKAKQLSGGDPRLTLFRMALDVAVTRASELAAAVDEIYPQLGRRATGGRVPS